MTKIALIVAVARNNVIGASNSIPWYCPADLQYFKHTTMGAPVLMGRKTYQSLKIKPLPGRRNIVITRNQKFTCDSCEVSLSIEEALNMAGNAKRIFIIGGENIYKQTLDKADELYITYVDAEVEGDRYFPDVSWNEWRLLREETRMPDENNPYGLTFKVYVRDSQH